jgi:hypothetical protein
LDRFPADFRFQLTREESNSLRFQIGTLKRGADARPRLRGLLHSCLSRWCATAMELDRTTASSLLKSS